MFVFGGNNGGIKDDYKITNSLRFRSSASAYLSRTPASSGNRKTWTWSGWVKRGGITSATHQIMVAGDGTVNNRFIMAFLNSTDTLAIQNSISGTDTVIRTTTQVFRDPSAWYHIVLAVDTTQATATNRTKLYINGNEVTSFSTSNDLTLNYDTYFNSTSYSNRIGVSTTAYFDGYMTEINFIDGQALTPSSFGYTHPKTGVWRPKPYTGTYGTNGFYLKFSDIALTSGSNAGLGKDFSSNGNYWTTNNISVTSGTTYDAMTDVPTLTSATAGNYCVLNPIDKGTSATISNANLSLTSGATHSAVRGTLTASKIYFEATNTSITSGSSVVAIGLATSATNLSATPVNLSKFWGIYVSNAHGITSDGTTPATFGSTSAAGTIFQLAYDPSTGNGWIGENNVWYNSSGGTTGNPSAGTNPTFTITVGTELFPYLECYSNTMSATFGQRPFTYTPPTGYKALNTYNLPKVTIAKGNKVMDATLYTGTGATISVTNAAGFKPDFVWLKGRSIAYENGLFDSVRGVTKYLTSNATSAESTLADTLTAFNSNGFTYGANVTQNNNGSTYVGWQWQAGQGTTSSNTNGSITSTVSVNASAGFSIVTYTGNGTIGATIGHGLGVSPSLIIAKRRNLTDNWSIYHKSLGATKYLFLNLTDAVVTNNTTWNNTEPTSSVFTVYNDNRINASASTYVAYCWAEIAGFSKFGSYTGNGSADGPFVYLGFRPKWVIIKSSTNGTTSWQIYDSNRNSYNVANNVLFSNLSDAEVSSSVVNVDFLSNGFKCRGTNTNINSNGATYIYAAFAENPFKYSNAR